MFKLSLREGGFFAKPPRLLLGLFYRSSALRSRPFSSFLLRGLASRSKSRRLKAERLRWPLNALTHRPSSPFFFILSSILTIFEAFITL